MYIWVYKKNLNQITKAGIFRLHKESVTLSGIYGALKFRSLL